MWLTEASAFLCLLYLFCDFTNANFITHYSLGECRAYRAAIAFFSVRSFLAIQTWPYTIIVEVIDI